MISNFDTKDDNDWYILNFMSQDTYDIKCAHNRKLKFIVDSQCDNNSNLSLDKLRGLLKQLINIDSLCLELNLLFIHEKDKIIYILKDIIIENIIKRYQESIQTLYISNFHLSFKKQMPSEVNIEQLLSQLFNPLKNLKTLIIEEIIYTEYTPIICLLDRVRNVIEQKQVILPNLSVIKIDQQPYDPQYFEQTKAQLYFDHLINLSDTFSAQDSIRNIQFNLQNLDLYSTQIKRLTSSLNKYTQLERISLNLYDNQQLQPKDLILLIKQISSQFSELEDLQISFKSIFNQKDQQQLYQYIKQLPKLTSIGIQGLTLESTQELFKLFPSLDQLVDITLDMSNYNMKTNFKQNMNIFNKSFTNLKNLNLHFPLHLSFKQQEMNSLCQVLENQQLTLECLQMKFNNQIDDESALLFVETVCKLEAIKELAVFFLGRSLANTIYINSQGNDEAQNIFECPKIKVYNLRFSEYFNFYLLLFFAIVKSQKYPIQEFITQYTVKNCKKFSSQRIKDTIIQYFLSLQSQKNIKIIEWNFQFNFNYLDFYPILRNNINSLIQLRVEIRDQLDLNEIIRCKNIVQLSINSQAQSVDVEVILDNLKSLQQYEYRCDGFQDTDFNPNPQTIFNSEYLTQLKLWNINLPTDYQQDSETYNICQQYLFSRQQTIIFITAYQQVISQLLVYKPMKTLWDIYL